MGPLFFVPFSSVLPYKALNCPTEQYIALVEFIIAAAALQMVSIRQCAGVSWDGVNVLRAAGRFIQDREWDFPGLGFLILCFS